MCQRAGRLRRDLLMNFHQRSWLCFFLLCYVLLCDVMHGDMVWGWLWWR